MNQKNIKRSIECDQRRLEHFKTIANRKLDYKLRSNYRKDRNRRYYYIIRPNAPERYVKQSEMHKVYRVQQIAFAREMVDVLTRNIKAKKKLLEDLLPDTAQDIIKRLPETYRPTLPAKGMRIVPPSENPSHPENLTVKTSFGLMVRSKGEAIIAEMLYQLGVEFYYEKKLRIYSKVQGRYVDYYPDFTIITAAAETIYWEHDGMLQNEEYVKGKLLKLMDYNANHIYEAHNLIISAEGPDNHLDTEGIRRIIEGNILPLIN